MNGKFRRPYALRTVYISLKHRKKQMHKFSKNLTRQLSKQKMINNERNLQFMTLLRY
jgi:hypothetical protein